jgi:hypothetical protein
MSQAVRPLTSARFEEALRVARKMLWLERNRPTWNFCKSGSPQISLIEEGVRQELLERGFVELLTAYSRDGEKEHARLTDHGRQIARHLGPIPVPPKDYFKPL